jgi:hypothetical protein
MSQKTDSTTEVSLKGPDNWDDWDHQFKIQATDARLWKHIALGEPLLDEPKPPLTGSYQRQTNPRARIATRPQEAERDLSPERSQTVDTEEDEQVPISALTDKGRASLQLAWQIYNGQDRKYQTQLNAVQALRKWVRTTVSPHYVRIACDPTETLTQWYANLKRHVGVSDDRSRLSAREEYRDALKPLSKLKDWSKWLSNWERAIGNAQSKKVPEALYTAGWVTDFLVSVRPIADTWATSYTISKREQIEKGLITSLDLAHDFRQEMRSRSGLKGRTPNIAKGAFGPSYAGQDNPDQDASGDAQNSAEGGGRRRGKKSAKHARASDEDDALPERSCAACGLPHLLANCFYVFRERAPQWFTENPEVRALVDRLLKTDLGLQEEVRRLKSKRSKPNPNKTKPKEPKPKTVEEEDD